MQYGILLISKGSTMKKEIIERYRSYMEMRGYSHTTIRNYLYIINDFAKHFDIPDEESVQLYLEKKNITRNSRATQVRIFRSLGKFMQKKYGMRFELPEAPRSGKTLPVFLTSGEVSQLLTSAKGNLRDFAMLSFIIYTGVRVNELVNIKIFDLDLIQNTVRVKGKGDKERIIPIAKPLSKLLKKYIAERKHKGRYLFESKFNEKLTPLTVQLIVKKYAKKAKIRKHITPHKLRHTFATLALQSGVSPITISELLGHSSLNTTMKYTHVTNKLTEDAVSRIATATDLEKLIKKK